MLPRTPATDYRRLMRPMMPVTPRAILILLAIVVLMGFLANAAQQRLPSTGGGGTSPAATGKTTMPIFPPLTCTLIQHGAEWRSECK